MTSAQARPRGPQAAPRRRVLARIRLDFGLDSAIFAGFLLAEAFGFTGLAIHEWLGLALGVVLLVHLTLHWDWVIRTTGRMLSRRGRDRFSWLVNLALLVSMTVCILSGILISQVALPRLGFALSGSGPWRGLHGTTATITLFLVGVHVALRWRWIVRVARRILPRRRTRGSW